MCAKGLPLREDAALPVDGVFRSSIGHDEAWGAFRQVRREQDEEEIVVGPHYDRSVGSLVCTLSPRISMLSGEKTLIWSGLESSHAVLLA